MILALEILAIISMCILIFVVVWGFVTLQQVYNQLKYKNYLLEKLNVHMHNLCQKFNVPDSSKDLKTQEEVTK
ncbi:uncharacterized protein YneF (UPF0154 family) [Clostridium pascui]|uniref:hypothetical protein n=1 Tax=Clostridium pascui TaxID=46609 RepID=UPI0019561F36|nr:hypothetical protein [Clostridium pascui]MBM7871886.1 uncharacterized protein YneF (UPF0154 family) [Clostridium pascui]